MELSSGRPFWGRAAPGGDCQPKTKKIQRYSSRDALLTLYGAKTTVLCLGPHRLVAFSMV